MRDIILGTVCDMVADFLFYDRKNDDELPEGAIEQALAEGVVTVEEIISTFEKELRDNI